MLRTRESSLEAHLPWLEEPWSAGGRNGAELWRRWRKPGFRGSLRVVTGWATRRRRAARAAAGALGRTPSARTTARRLSIGRDGLSRSEMLTVAAIEDGVPSLVEARALIASFQGLVHKRSSVDLDPWLARARSSLIASFAAGVMKDLAAVTAALSLPWSNRQTERQITKLKLVTRQILSPREDRHAPSAGHLRRVAVTTKTTSEPSRSDRKSRGRTGPPARHRAFGPIPRRDVGKADRQRIVGRL